MVRAKEYIGTDVLTAARERIEHIFYTFDSVAVMFSGGKDSLACVHLVKEFHDEHDLGPVNVIFRDEEVINPSVIDFVASYRNLDWVNLRWYCVPMRKQRVVLDRKLRYVEWDPEREWVHPMPDFAISAETLGMKPGEVLTEHTMDDKAAEEFPGRVAFITGVRAQESLVRFRAVTQKLNENYISKIEGNERSRVRLCKPIYDWSQMDVLKYLYDNDIAWCSVYDAQELARVGLRVSTPLHAGSAKKFGSLRETEPEFYQRCVEIFPEMIVQERYHAEFDTTALLAPYLEDGFNGIVRFIREKIDGEEAQATAMKRAKEWKGRWRKDPDNYPLHLLLETLAFGFTKRRLAGVYTESRGEKAKRARKEKTGA